MWAIAKALAEVIGPRQVNLPTNMQEVSRDASKPLLVGDLPMSGGCLKSRRFAKYTRHLPNLY